MTKRIVMLTLALWVALYVAEWMLSRAFDLMGFSMAEAPWTVIVTLLGPAAVASWAMGRWHMLSGGRLLIVIGASLAITALVWASTGAALSALPQLSILASRGEEPTLLMAYLVLAIESVLVAWVMAHQMATHMPNKRIQPAP